MSYARAVDAPVHYQWDDDSRFPLPDPGSAPDNCGPATIENIAHYYTERSYGIYRTRLLAAPSYGPTSVTSQRIMLERRGVPCLVGQWPVSSIKRVVAGGRHPVALGLLYKYVPDEVAGHPFDGWHSIEVLDDLGADALVRDPNFNRTYRQDPTNGRRRYPWSVIQRAFVDVGGWGIMPTKSKLVSLPDTATSEILRADGDLGMRFRSVDYRRTLLARKPIRKGIRVNSGTWRTFSSRKSLKIVGRIPKSWLPESERQFGDVLITKVYVDNGDRFGYIKQVDLAGN